MSSNSELKWAFQQIHVKLVNINAASAIDRLFQENVISSDDNDDLTHPNLNRAAQVRRLMALLHKSDHPRAFIVLREALKKDYDYIVKMVDELCLKAGSTPSYTALFGGVWTSMFIK